MVNLCQVLIQQRQPIGPFGKKDREAQKLGGQRKQVLITSDSGHSVCRIMATMTQIQIEQDNLLCVFFVELACSILSGIGNIRKSDLFWFKATVITQI